MFQKKFADKIKTQILCSIFFPPKIVPLDNVEIFCRAEQATDDNIVAAHCMLDA